MKEATGELNGTVIVFAAVALLAAFFFTIVWPKIRLDMTIQSTCANAICDVGYNDQFMTDCYTPGNKTHTFLCPYKG